MSALITVCSSPAASLEALRKLCSWAQELRLVYAWASSEDGKSAHWHVLPLEKVTRATIGTKFASTEPWILRKLLDCGRDVLRVIVDSQGVFHPKVILGICGNEAQALLGSSNFTSGGFGTNTELNVHLFGFLNESPMIDIAKFMNEQWLHKGAFLPSEGWLERYEEAYRSRPVPQSVPPRPAVRPPPRPAVRPPKPVPVLLSDASQLSISWDDYFGMIRRRDGYRMANGHQMRVFDHPGNSSYLQETERCQNLFLRFGSFAGMPLNDRKFVAGFGGTSGYFGRMGGAGNFKKIVSRSPLELSTALDEIPTAEAVNVDHVRAVLDQALSIFGVNLGTATRLLVAKRPDSFISLNKGSRRRIKEVFKAAPTRPEPYLRLLEQIWEYPWVQSVPPSDHLELRVWNARVALLDALMYEPQ